MKLLQGFFLFCSLLILALVSYLYVDYPLAKFLCKLPRPCKTLIATLSLLACPKLHLFLWPVCFALSFQLSFLKEYRRLFLHAVLAIGMIMLLLGLLKMSVGRPRPDFSLATGIFEREVWTKDSTYLSFPSSHAAAAFGLLFLSLPLFPLRSRFLLYTLLSSVLALTRVALLRHYFSDVAIGGLLGFSISFTVSYACSKFSFIFEKYFPRLL